MPFVRDSYRGEIPVNYFAARDDDRGVIMFGAPGLRTITNVSGSTGVRGLYYFSHYKYLCLSIGNGTNVYQVDMNGNPTLLGQITTSSEGPMWIEDNGFQIAFCDGVTMYVYNAGSGVFSQVTDADFPGAGTLTYQDGYGIFSEPDSARFWLTSLYDFTQIDALDYATKMGASDNLRAVKSDHRELWLFGTERSIEVWQNTGNSLFPFERISGGYLEDGLAAVAGVVSADQSLFYLSINNQIKRVVANYQTTIVSNRKVDREIGSYEKVDDCIAISYNIEGHIMVEFTFPTANKTLVYDCATQQWYRRTSYPQNGRHRASCYCYDFDNQIHLVGDYAKGIMYEMTRGSYHEETDGEVLTGVLNSGGTGYAAGEILTVVYTNGSGCTFLVDTVDPDTGEILSLVSEYPTTGGLGYALAVNLTTTSSGGGTGATIDITQLVYHELIAVLPGVELQQEGKRIFFKNLQIEFDQGVVPSWFLRTPQAALDSYDNGGKTYIGQQTAPMGNIGEYGRRTVFTRLGSAYSRIFELTVSDPVNRDILGVDWT